MPAAFPDIPNLSTHRHKTSLILTTAATFSLILDNIVSNSWFLSSQVFHGPGTARNTPVLYPAPWLPKHALFHLGASPRIPLD